MKKAFPRILFCLALLLLFTLWIGMESEVSARAGGGRSSGSRSFGSGRSYQPSTPPSSPQRNYQPSRPAPAPQAAPAAPGRSFLSGLAGGMVGGLLGGMLFRSLGFAGGPGMGGGFGFGDLFLILVVLAIIYFVVKRFRARQTMQMSAAGAGAGSYSYGGTSPEPAYTPPPFAPDGNSRDFGAEAKHEGLRHIREMDPSFDERAFRDQMEDIFFKIQGAWTRRDLSPVRQLLTPEMLDTFKGDIDKLRAARQFNRLENIAVREVEIVEAGQDRGEEFITVRFYANLLDYVLHEETNQIVSGSTTDPVKFVEFWRFSRQVGEKKWILSGIMQEADR